MVPPGRCKTRGGSESRVCEPVYRIDLFTSRTDPSASAGIGCITSLFPENPSFGNLFHGGESGPTSFGASWAGNGVPDMFLYYVASYMVIFLLATATQYKALQRLVRVATVSVPLKWLKTVRATCTKRPEYTIFQPRLRQAEPMLRLLTSCQIVKRQTAVCFPSDDRDAMLSRSPIRVFLVSYHMCAATGQH